MLTHFHYFQYDFFSLPRTAIFCEFAGQLYLGLISANKVFVCCCEKRRKLEQCLIKFSYWLILRLLWQEKTWSKNNVFSFLSITKLGLGLGLELVLLSFTKFSQYY